MAQRRLTRRQTIEKLRILSAEHSRSYSWLDKRHRALIIGCFLHFGGLTAARKAAGVPDPKPPHKWSIDRIVNELRAENRAGVRITVQGLIAVGRGDLVAALAKHIGGIVPARRLAKIPHPHRLRGAPEPWGSWDEDRVVAEIRARHRAGHVLAKSRTPVKLSSAGARLFGSWRNAVEVSGFDYDSIQLQRPPYTKSQIRAALRRMKRERPKTTRAELYVQPFASAVMRLFGSLDRALRFAGIVGWPRSKQRTWNRERVLAALREYPDRSPGDSLGELATLYFGGVPEARIAAGLSPLRERWTRERVIADLQALARKDDYPGRNLSAACERLFGGVVAARRAANIERPGPVWSPERVVADLRANARRGNLTVVEPLMSACITHFGSVSAARLSANLAREIAAWPAKYLIAARSHPFKDPYIVASLKRRASKLNVAATRSAGS